MRTTGAAWRGGMEAVVELPQWQEVLEKNPRNRARFLSMGRDEFLAVMDRWMTNIRLNPRKGIHRNKPAEATDACYDLQGRLMHRGDDAWNGILDNKAPGVCTQAFPLYATSRIVAGAPIKGGIYDCARKSVDAAVADGTYAPWAPNPTEIVQLKQIFPEGVCDYSRPDQARP